MNDNEIERRLESAYQALTANNSTREQKQVAAAQIACLNKQRSAERVRALEKERGLAA